VTGPARLALALALAAAAAAARADEPKDHWDTTGEARPFLSAQVDVGVPEHASVALGYGKPHNMWGGLLAQGFLTGDFGGARLGAKVDLLALALEGGLRWSRSWTHLPMANAGQQTGIPARHGFTSRALDLSASGGLPLGPGFAIYEVLGVKYLSSHGDVQIYDEVNRIVFRPPWLATASAGWVASLRAGALLAGGRVQWAFETGRGGDPFVRLGPVLYWRLLPRVALAGELLYPVSDPDRLGLLVRTEAFLVLSYTVATGDTADSRLRARIGAGDALSRSDLRGSDPRAPPAREVH
jgi:hypothetical protein